MRKLNYSVDIAQFKKIKQDIVPVIFTEHQFSLIEKRFSNKPMSKSERSEFSRSISKKMDAIKKISGNAKDVFIFEEEKMILERKEKAVALINTLSRKFRNKHIIITGSFLFSKIYDDLDVFVISKYEKDDYRQGKMHINYLTEDAYGTLFFQSIARLAISNKLMPPMKKEAPSIDKLISLYQELYHDFDKNAMDKNAIREFIIQSESLRGEIPDSEDLKKKTDMVLKAKNKKEIIKSMFISAAIFVKEKKKMTHDLNEIMDSYRRISEEYPQHKKYYADAIEPFLKVIEIES